MHVLPTDAIWAATLDTIWFTFEAIWAIFEAWRVPMEHQKPNAEAV